VPARGRIGHHLYSCVRLPLVGDRIEIVHQWQDFHLCFFALEERHDLVVHRTRLALVIQQVEEHVRFGHSLQPAIWRQGVQPFGKQQVDLLVIVTERGEAGGVPLHVEGTTNAFLRIEGDLRRWFLGGAMLVRPRNFFRLLGFLKRVIRLLDFRQADARHRGPTEDRHHEKRDQHSDNDHADIEQSAQPAPALAFGIKENGFRAGHAVRTL